ncbi:MAG: cytidylate kinase-like family protein, partial [Firmicutes bacterium]|nr:cytidylate kinase-like family protein [Bacillota bacterium]
MNNQHTIITISRQYGSQGQEIGRMLAEYLDIGYYNKKIMGVIANMMNISPEFFDDKNVNDLGLYNIESKGFFGFGRMAELSINTDVFEKASELIREISYREDAVIVGRCADYILEDNPNLISVFVYSNFEDRVRWSIEATGASDKKTRKRLIDHDEKRAKFYQFYTNRDWGNAANYNIMINTSRVSVKEAVELLAILYDEKKGHTSLKGGFVDQYIQHA